MRVREPDREGYVERDGVKVFWEVHGDGPSTIYLVPTFPIVELQWTKTLIPYLSRHFRVVTNDPRGNGRSDRPTSPEANSSPAHAGDVLAVMDATGTDKVLLVGVSQGVVNALLVHQLAAGRIEGMVLSSPFIPTVEEIADEYTAAFEATYDRPTGDELFSRQGLRDHYAEFCTWWMKERVLTEPHSRSAQRDMLEYCANASPESILAGEESFVADAQAAWREAARVRCPVLVHHGEADAIDVCPVSNAERLAEVTRGELVIVDGGGHASLVQDAVFGARMIRDFAERVFPYRPKPATRTWARAASRPKRALFVATALGLGHVRRDIAVARELRRHHPDLHVSWLAQHPATVVLAEAGEQLHPASRWLGNESAHVEEYGHEHDLAVFDALTRMDDVFVNNFLVFNDVVDDEPVDLVVADEGWDVDHHLHENPELKRFAYAWMSDWVGFLPVPERGPEEADWTADCNAQLVEHRARYDRVRDLSLFVGERGCARRQPRTWPAEHAPVR